MADYKAPLRDMRFVLNEVFEVASLWAQLPALAETVDVETVEAILEEAGKVTAKSIAPLSRSGDEEGCHWKDTVVTPPPHPHPHLPHRPWAPTNSTRSTRCWTTCARGAKRFRSGSFAMVSSRR